VSIRHKFRSPISDDGLPDGAVKPSNWNDDHAIDGVLGALQNVGAAPNVLPYLDAAMQGQLATLTDVCRLMLACVGVADVIAYLGATPSVSPHLGGIPTAPTAAVGTNTDQIATMAAVQNAINALVGGAPDALNTLNELAASLNDDTSFSATVTNALALRLRVDAVQGLSAAQLAQARANLALGTASLLDVGTTGNKVVQLDASGRLPPLDGSQLSGVVPAVSPASIGFVNKFRNGTMDVWQRGASLSPAAATSGAVIAADGWYVGWSASAASAPTIGQASGRALTANCLGIVSVLNITDIWLLQRIESLVAAPLSGQQVTVQAWVFTNATEGIAPRLTVSHANAPDEFNSVTVDVNAAALQLCAKNAWTRVAYTFAADPSSRNGLGVSFDFGAVPAAATVLIAELDIRVTPGLPVGLNAAPPAPELRPVATEMAFCQRYYFQWNSIQNQVLASGVFNAANICASRPFPVTMRTVPQVGFSSTAAFQMYNGTNFYSIAAGPMSADNQTAYFANQPAGGSLPPGGAVILGTSTGLGYFFATAEI
jgi:hypothetical protein